MAGTQWVRIDTGYLRNPKVQRAGRDGALLHLAAILYLGEHRIDSGWLPPEALPFVALDAGIRKVEPVVARVVAAGLWHPDLDAGGFVVHDYDETNGGHSEAASARERKRRWRDRNGET